MTPGSVRLVAFAEFACHPTAVSAEISADEPACDAYGRSAAPPVLLGIAMFEAATRSAKA